VKVGLRHEAPSYGFLLFLVFLHLKLSGKIAWSWLWVTAPLWLFFVPGLILSALAYIALTIRARRLIAANHREFVRQRKAAGIV
jgi:cell division protein FtsL